MNMGNSKASSWVLETCPSMYFKQLTNHPMFGTMCDFQRLTDRCVFFPFFRKLTVPNLQSMVSVSQWVRQAQAGTIPDQRSSWESRNWETCSSRHGSVTKHLDPWPVRAAAVLRSPWCHWSWAIIIASKIWVPGLPDRWRLIFISQLFPRFVRSA